MKYLQSKTNKLMKLVIEWELVRGILKFVIANTLLPFSIRQFAAISLLKLPFSTSISYIKLRCVISNQARSILTFFKLNRMQFKVLSSRGCLVGVKKNMF